MRVNDESNTMRGMRVAQILGISPWICPHRYAVTEPPSVVSSANILLV